MNKWEDSFKKNENACYCSTNQGLFVPNRQLSVVIAGFLFLCFCIFITGYFLGKKNVAEQSVQAMQQEAFADHIYSSVLTAEQKIESHNTSTLLASQSPVIEIVEQLITQDDTQIAVVVPQNESTQRIIQYYAQLIGFGTEKSAHLFVNKLAAKGIQTEIKKRVSKTVKGKTSYWYQVVTPLYSNKDDLSQLVDKITKEENIKDASIRVC
jgi:hypothetical protein